MKAAERVFRTNGAGPAVQSIVATRSPLIASSLEGVHESRLDRLIDLRAAGGGASGL